MSLATVGICSTISPPLSGAMERQVWATGLSRQL